MKKKKSSKKNSKISRIILITIIIFSIILFLSIFNIWHLDDSLLALTLPQQDKIGTFYVPDYHIKVPLYEVKNEDEEAGEKAQKYTDAVHSAVYLGDWCSIPVIGDHNYQDFAPFDSILLGTESYIVYADGIRKDFVCYEAGYGINDGCTLFDDNGDDWNAWNGCDLATYTCDEDEWESIVLVKWKQKLSQQN